MSRFALSALGVAYRPVSSAVADFSRSGQSMTLILIVVVVVALALTVGTARVLGRLVAVIVAGLWTYLTLLALLAVLLLCLLLLLARGG